MKSTTSLGLLVLAVIATPLLAFWPTDQEPAKGDYTTHVEKACESPRYGIRLAAARKVADGGDAAVPAIRAYAEKKGKNQLPVSLVDAIADGPVEASAVRALLEEWAQQGDFYWRSSAMRGLAVRMPALCAQFESDDMASPDLRVHFSLLFAKYHDDPAWLMRTHARFGSALVTGYGIGVAGAVQMPESDPRARVRLVKLLLEQGKTPPLQPLFDALADERTFLGDPWGKRLGAEAFKALKIWLGDDHPLAKGDSFADEQQGIAALRDAAQKKSGQSITMPIARSDTSDEAADGIEILSCSHGDQFLQWSPDGTLRFGIDGQQQVKLSDEVWRELLQDRTDIAIDKNQGVVICDSMRVRVVEPGVHVKVAPESLPEPAAEWLKRLAQRLEEAGEKDVADRLRRGLSQFEGR